MPSARKAGLLEAVVPKDAVKAVRKVALKAVRAKAAAVPVDPAAT
jgi:hypothetical protein